MISYLKGMVLRDEPGLCTVYTFVGVGYQVHIDESFDVEIVDHLYIQTVQSQDSTRLFGFVSQNSRDMFRQLTSVNGVGPSAAMSILSTLQTASRVADAIASGNVAAIQSAKGVGKKTAEMIIMQLKDKYTKASSAETLKKVELDEDTVKALCALGYKRKEVSEAMTEIYVDIDGKPTPEQVSITIKYLTTNGKY